MISRLVRRVAMLGLMGLAAPCAEALVITPTFDSTITSDVNAATIESTINTAIQSFENLYTNNVTVTIKFAEGGGLGGSTTYITDIPYALYYQQLKTVGTTAVATEALASLPNQTDNPVNGNADVYLTTANARAIGIDPSFGVSPPAGQFDSTITLNTSIMNLTRTSINPSFYDLQAVASHEIDEALGIGSQLTNVQNGGGSLSNPVSLLDLYRYASAGVRSYTMSSSAQAYFSVDSGVTLLEQFNQTGNGADYNDWASGAHP